MHALSPLYLVGFLEFLNSGPFATCACRKTLSQNCPHGEIRQTLLEAQISYKDHVLYIDHVWQADILWMLALKRIILCCFTSKNGAVN